MSGKTGTAPGTTTITLPGGKSISFADWIDNWHWTMIELENGDNETLNAFVAGKSQPITGGTRGMTLVDTNIPGSGLTGLPKSWEFMIYGLAFEFMRVMRADAGETNPRLSSFSDPLTLRTYFEVTRRIYNKYVYNQKMYSEGLIGDYPAGHGVSLVTTNAATEIANNGIASPRDRVALVIPIEEEELLGYEMQITPVIPLVIAQPASDGGTILSFLDLRPIKNGLIKRQVT
ncbi:hypothetical protein LCGC14_2036960 [marine sediment metagenome]|uniref:Uncharacterized protein n=1 Tax=marine sediment metagenome TaxID=412755 RepID=A0A0F9H6G4_9ZZZZ